MENLKSHGISRKLKRGRTVVSSDHSEIKLSLSDYDGDGAGEGNALWKRKRLNNVIRLLNKSSETPLPRAYTFWCIF